MNFIMDSKADGGLVPVAWLFTWRAPNYVVQSSGDSGTNIKDIDTMHFNQIQIVLKVYPNQSCKFGRASAFL